MTPIDETVQVGGQRRRQCHPGGCGRRRVGGAHRSLGVLLMTLRQAGDDGIDELGHGGAPATEPGRADR